MSVRVKFEMTPESQALIQRMATRPARLRKAMKSALRQGLEETAAHLQTAYLRGGSVATRRDGSAPLAVRSGSLLRSVVSRVDQALSGFIGAGGSGAPQAGVLLGAGETTIKPVNAKHLWIPVADNLTRSGQARLSPRAAFDLVTPSGKKALRIFRSRKGNLVAGVSDKDVKLPGVSRKGFKLLFALKDQVTVKGTDALALAVDDKRDRIRDIIQRAVTAVLRGEDAGSDSGGGGDA